MKNDDKWVVHRIVFPDNWGKEPEVFKHENFEKYTIEHNIGIEIIEHYDKWLLDFLYEQYAKLGAHTLFILNKTQFKDFISKYLPKYMEELKNE